MSYIIAGFAGFFLGALFGVFIMALMVAAKDGDRFIGIKEDKHDKC